MYGLANMALFLIIVNYIAALVAVQLLRGDFTSNEQVNFGQVWNSFLAMYQVFSSENWPTVMYGSATTEIPLGQVVFTLIFVSGWFLFANCELSAFWSFFLCLGFMLFLVIVLQMFIAVINENFEVAEEQKKSKQTSHFYSQQKARLGTVTWLRRLNPYRWVKASPVTVKVDNLPSNLVLPMQKVLVQDKYSRLDAVRTAAAVSFGLILFYFIVLSV
jgi:voltage-dependent calcium channel